MTYYGTVALGRQGDRIIVILTPMKIGGRIRLSVIPRAGGESSDGGKGLDSQVRSDRDRGTVMTPAGPNPERCGGRLVVSGYSLYLLDFLLSKCVQGANKLVDFCLRFINIGLKFFAFSPNMSFSPALTACNSCLFASNFFTIVRTFPQSCLSLALGRMALGKGK